ncbi:MAG TPA: hypothetical protein VHE34_09455 [Puia sp.]|uniref:hypothetical protein n=1 Tax=Puia sp. TaxID=2045100 RepID=UPI002C22E6C0|nr:hypothetical protein [Puia sp.]HVU95440.1 hypothetical protein [Puia sp.]
MDIKLPHSDNEFARFYYSILPVGTIITSYLTWPEFSQSTGIAVSPWDPGNSAWSPADGRIVSGSKFESITRQENVPDYRGVFMRCQNQIDPQTASTVPPIQADPDNSRNRAVIQGDALGSHTHPASGRITGNITGSNGTHDCDGGGDKYNSDPTFPDRNVAVTVYPSGGAETRPKNASVFYYIKIN